MSATVRVVVRFADGRVMKGATQDFNPAQPHFHLLPAQGGAPVDVRCAELKALFFVKTFEGDPQHARLRGFPAEAPAAGLGRKVAVLFKDGELVCGYALSYTPDRFGFFLSPADADGNNIRVFVVTAAAAEVTVGPAAEELVQRVVQVTA